MESSPYIGCMLTAAYIAQELGEQTIVINYRASEVFDGYKYHYNHSSPMPCLDYVRHDCDFINMKNNVKEYQELFPLGVNFIEPIDAEYKDEIFKNCPESSEKAN